jgi:hypothetical protein
MYRIKTSHLLMLLGVIAPVCSYASNYCIKVNGGFPGGGTSFIEPTFSIPVPGTCAPWSGFTKTADTVIFTTTGTGCTSTNGNILTIAVTSIDPANVSGAVADYILLCAHGFDTCTIGSGVQEDQGNFSGPAAQETCSATLLKLPPSHD